MSKCLPSPPKNKSLMFWSATFFLCVRVSIKNCHLLKEKLLNDKNKTQNKLPVYSLCSFITLHSKASVLLSTMFSKKKQNNNNNTLYQPLKNPNPETDVPSVCRLFFNGSKSSFCTYKYLSCETMWRFNSHLFWNQILPNYICMLLFLGPMIFFVFILCNSVGSSITTSFTFSLGQSDTKPNLILRENVPNHHSC